MKNIKNLILAASALLLVALFTMAPAGAYDKTNDFYQGQKAGFAMALDDTAVKNCIVGFESIENLAREGSAQYINKLVDQDRSDDYIKGFRMAYESNFARQVDTNCGS